MKLRERTKGHEIALRLGLTLGKGRYYLWGLGFALLGIVISIGVLKLIPANVMNDKIIATSRFVGQPLTLMTFLSALFYGIFETSFGEELIFRGLIGGLLDRRTKFWVANVIQAVIFTLPHLLILTIDLRLWPIAFALPFVSGLMLGWLRLKSGSIVPGWIMHGLGNIFSAIAVMSI
jgi:membrane protease YdiL (CAAX protease family)